MEEESLIDFLLRDEVVAMEEEWRFRPLLRSTESKQIRSKKKPGRRIKKTRSPIVQNEIEDTANELVDLILKEPGFSRFQPIDSNRQRFESQLRIPDTNSNTTEHKRASRPKRKDQRNKNDRAGTKNLNNGLQESDQDIFEFKFELLSIENDYDSKRTGTKRENHRKSKRDSSKFFIKSERVLEGQLIMESLENRDANNNSVVKELVDGSSRKSRRNHRTKQNQACDSPLKLNRRKRDRQRKSNLKNGDIANVKAEIKMEENDSKQNLSTGRSKSKKTRESKSKKIREKKKNISSEAEAEPRESNYQLDIT